MSGYELLAVGTLVDYAKYNKTVDYYSEARPFNLEVMDKWIAIRNNYTYVDEWTEGNWKSIDIKTCHSKYGTNYIFIDDERKLWRIRDTASEFYGSIPAPFEFN